MSDAPATPVPPPAAAPDLFGILPAVPTDPTAARVALAALEAAAFATTNHPLVDGGHVQHDVMQQHRRALAAAAYPEPQAEAPDPPSIDGKAAVALAFRDLEISAARIDGAG